MHTLAENKPSADSGKFILSEPEKKVIAILREIKYGEVKVVVQDSIPIRVDEIRKSIKI